MNTWYFPSCIQDILPFNALEGEEVKRIVLDFSDTGRILYFSDKLFLPFELNDDESHDITKDMDPDVKYYCSYNQYVSRCNFFIEASFIKEMANCIEAQTSLSLCSFNIRSLGKIRKSWYFASKVTSLWYSI